MINLRSVLADYAFTFSEALSTIQILPRALTIILPQVVLSPLEIFYPLALYCITCTIADFTGITDTGSLLYNHPQRTVEAVKRHELEFVPFER